MHKVMLPVDGSRSSENAARYLVGCFRDVGALDIHLLNVQAQAEGWEVKRFLRDEELDAMAREYGEAALASTRAILDAATIPYTTHIEQGEVAETIARMTEQLSCDQVVMGSHGRGALQGLLLGSVATKVLHRVAVPVTLVK
jgi:nucleotide-binding universal stress UspA family protein